MPTSPFSTISCSWPRLPPLERLPSTVGINPAATVPEVSTAPVVLRFSGTPFLSVATTVVALYFLVKAFLMDGGVVLFSLIMAAALIAVAAWWLVRVRRFSVVIDGDRLIINRGRRTATYDRTSIESVNLADHGRHVRFRDGSAIGLPLEGSALIEAGLLLSPGRTTSLF